MGNNVILLQLLLCLIRLQITTTIIPSSLASGPPTNITILTLSDNTIPIDWFPPLAIERNDIILSYNITYYGNPIDTNLTVEEVMASPNQENSIYYVILEAYNNYTFVISAVNSIGVGMESEPMYIETQPTAPDQPPQILIVEFFEETRILLGWLPPLTEAQNGLITSYIIQVVGNPFPSMNEFINVSNITTDYPATDTVTYLLSGPEEFNNYTFSVAAVNSEGIGPYTNELTQETLPAAPDMSPRNVTAFSDTTTQLCYLYKSN
ncbi:Protein sidekick-1-like [Oopsacas minuta]|uniref:Protein sidekick-1-like n=1 Tax=Oopsacas minuta TaxID=111878 RepID=A0AAV7KJI6_9METZ|nr:Protein sidekick-1-like [Oopsacas minuta]